MDGYFLYGIGLVATHAKWIGVNLVLPVALPVLGVGMIAMLKPASHRYLTKLVLDTIRFGQLGWIAIAWISSALFDGWQYMSITQASHAWMGWSLVAGFPISVFGTYSAVVCAESAERSIRHCVGVFMSITVALLAAATAIYIHDQIVSGGHYAAA